MTDQTSHIAPVAAATPKSGYLRVLRAVLQFVRTQGTQPSTWRGIVMIISACGIYIRPELAAAITAVGMALSGAIGVLAGPDAPVDAATGER